MQENGILRVLVVYPDEDGDEWLRKSSQVAAVNGSWHR
jgi:hypothetical protein